EEEHRCAVGVQVAQQPTVVDIAHDDLNGLEGEVDMRGVVHRQHDAGDDLYGEHECEDAAERPQVVQVTRDRVDDERGMNETADRKPPPAEFQKIVLRFVGSVCDTYAPWS